MSVARRTLLTATTAGTLLAALWFVPSANATVENTPGAPSPAAADQADGRSADDGSGPRLAATGPGLDTTPYLIGGTALLGIGAGFVTSSVRRSGPRRAR
ncbi:hypothetical protein [Streptomyces sp. NPDC101181]|uniref:hypothetical protein n=1 Tax=Streptomyces sp. NPDC101181 TaxID=3366125 RepID=UPI0038031992